jgi:hypothetical protein
MTCSLSLNSAERKLQFASDSLIQSCIPSSRVMAIMVFTVYLSLEAQEPIFTLMKYLTSLLFGICSYEEMLKIFQDLSSGNHY